MNVRLLTDKFGRSVTSVFVCLRSVERPPAISVDLSPLLVFFVDLCVYYAGSRTFCQTRGGMRNGTTACVCMATCTRDEIKPHTRHLTAPNSLRSPRATAVWDSSHAAAYQ